MRFLLAAVFLATHSAQVSAQDWLPVRSTGIEFNKARIAPRTYRVWEKFELTGQALEYARSQAYPAKHADYSHSVALVQIDCAGRKHGLVSITNYTSTGFPAAPPIGIPNKRVKMLEAAPDTSADAVVSPSLKFNHRAEHD